MRVFRYRRAMEPTSIALIAILLAIVVAAVLFFALGRGSKTLNEAGCDADHCSTGSQNPCIPATLQKSLVTPCTEIRDGEPVRGRCCFEG